MHIFLGIVIFLLFIGLAYGLYYAWKHTTGTTTEPGSPPDPAGGKMGNGGGNVHPK